MTAEVTEDERFSIVEEGETRFLRYERKQGDTWATIWENDAIFCRTGNWGGFTSTVLPAAVNG